MERASTREWLERVAIDHDAADATAPRARRKVYNDPRDKLGPAKRWLASRVGRPWTKVYSELRAQFDSRTIAGAHVVNDHMLGWVWRGDVSELGNQRFGFDFIVDAHGILRRGTWFGRSYYRVLSEAFAWANERRAALTYRGWLWLRREPVGARCLTYPCALEHHLFDRWRHHGIRMVADGPLTRGDLRRLDRLPLDIRNQLVVPASAVGM